MSTSVNWVGSINCNVMLTCFCFFKCGGNSNPRCEGASVPKYQFSICITSASLFHITPFLSLPPPLTPSFSHSLLSPHITISKSNSGGFPAPLLLFICLVNKTLAHVFLLMLLLILCLFGQARADTGDQVDGVDPPYLFLLMVSLITHGIVLGVYLKGRKIIPSQEHDTDSPHTICRLVDPLDLLPLSYLVRVVYPRRHNTDSIQSSTDTPEASYPADPSFDPSATSFGGGNSEIAQHHLPPITPLPKKRENVPDVVANGLPHRHDSNEKDKMTFVWREVEVRFPCGSCDSDSGSCDVSMYLYNINVNVEPEGVAAMLEFTPNDEDDMLDEDEEDHPSLFVGVSE